MLFFTCSVVHVLFMIYFIIYYLLFDLLLLICNFLLISSLHCLLLFFNHYFSYFISVEHDAYAAFMAAGSKREYGDGNGVPGGNSNNDEPDRISRGSKYNGDFTPVSSQETALNEENEGHKLLKRMGWTEGSGLGVEGSGIIEPIRETVKKDKTGIGSGSNEAVTEFSTYRSQLSAEYFSRTW